MRNWWAGTIVTLSATGFYGCVQAPPGGDNTGTDGADKTGILLMTPAGSVAESYDLYDATGTVLLHQALSTDELEEVDPGTYVLTEYFNDEFVYANAVMVNAGQTTTIELGAVDVVTAPGSQEATYDIYDSTGTAVLTDAESSDTIRPLPAGTYVIKRYSNPDFTYAEDVIVSAGQVTTISMGAFELVTGVDWSDSSYDVYAADGMSLLSRPESVNKLVPLPPGSYAIKAYFNDAFVYTSSTQVSAGQTTRFEMGAILYTGAEASYDIYDASGNTLLDRPVSRGEARPAPPGTFVLKKYFSDDLIASGVMVNAGGVTTVP